MRLDRRAFLLGVGAGAGWLLTGGVRVGEPRSFAGLLAELGASLGPGQRAHVVFPADHPTRQINNTFSVLRGPHLATLLSPHQLRLARALYESMLSEKGRADLQGTIAVEGRLEGTTLAIYGDPADPAAQAVISGGHLLVRGGAEGTALAGGVAYGHQIGNGLWRVPGNSFAHHGDAFDRFFATLPETQRLRAILPEPPHELVLQPQTRAGRFPGLRLAEAPEASREAAQELVATLLSAYPEAERAAALDALAHHGGVEALHDSTFASKGFYPDMENWGELPPEARAARGEPYWQVWRLEGPGSVMHFQGHPHVHAYLQIVRDPTRANLGESLAHTSTTLDAAPLRRLLEAALRRATGERHAYYGAQVPGRFCAGEVTTGLAYALDPYANRVVVATVPAQALSDAAKERLARGGVSPADAELRVATTDYLASRSDELGVARAVESDGLLVRDALIAEIRANGLAAAGA